MYRSSVRTRAGSVERSSIRDSQPYRTSYSRERSSGSGDTARMSRATSYDPFAKSVSSNRSGSVIRNSSYNLKSSTISSNRYGSTEQLMNSYKSPMSSSYTPRASSGTARSVRAGSCTFYSGAYDSPSPTQLSRYRPPEKPSYTSTLTKYRSTDLSSTSDYSTAKYSSRSSLENSSYSGKYSSYSSSKSSPYSSRNTTSSSYRSDRDYKSMSRYEKTDSEEEDNVESTFQKLYKKYVTESEPDLTKEESLAEKVARRFESKSEAETSDDGVDEDEDTEMVFKSYERRGLRRASSASSITPRASKCSSPSKDLTPKASPMLQRKINVIPVLSSSESSADEDIPPIVVPSQQRKVIGATIKINGRPVTSSDEINNEPNTQSVRIKLKRSSIPVEEVAEQQQISEVVKTEITVESKEAPSENRKDREKSSSEESSSSRSTLNRRRRDPNRTIEQLRTSLMAEKVQNEPLKIDNDDTAQVQQEPKMRKIPIPIVLITEPSNPSTPLATTPVQTAASICLWNKRESISDEDEDEEYEDEEEYTSGEWSEDEEDEEDEEYSDVEFSVSQTFSLKDHLPFDNLYPLATSTSATSAVVSEFGASGDGDAGDNLNDLFLKQSRKEESRGRVDSLFAMPAPTFTCSVSYDGMTHDNDDDWMSDEVHSCDDDEDEEDIDDEDFRVIPIARPGSSSLGAYMSPGSLTSDEDYDGQTVGCTLKLVDRAAQKDESDESEYYDDEEVDEYSDEEYWDEEEDEEEEEEFEDEEMLEEFIDEQEYCSNEDEEFSIESNVEDEIPLEFVPDLKPMTESLVEEMIEEAIYSNLPDEQIIAIDGVEVEDYISTSNINIVPTFVRQMTENIKEEMTSRFSDRKPTTDFAKKAVIQPAKLEKVKIETVETKIAKAPEVVPVIEKPTATTKTVADDKSAVRKSALNMKEEDAKKKVAADEKAAAKKARMTGTVTALAEQLFKEESKKMSPVLYRKSTRLQPKDVDEKPKRVYEVVKPVINDEFDKQMAEIRQQMKTGSNELQTKMKDLSKGIHTVSEEKKMRDMQEKRRMTSEKVTGAIEKATEEKARWKAARDAEAEREYARIEAEKHLRRKKILIDKPVTNVEAEQPAKAEPKRTIRRWKPPPPDPNANIPLFSTGPKEIKPKSAAAQAPPPQPSTSSSSKPSTPVMKKKSLELIESKKPSDCAEIVGQVNRIATADVKPNIPKSEGAAATRIKNNIINNSPVVVEKSSSKRYNSRRKTQEIVNESIVKPKCKRRKLTARRKRFICADKDVDKILGYQKCTTFEQFENLFNSSSKNRREIEKKLQKEKIRRLTPSKIFISDLTDIDKIYKSSEIRDIIASVNVIY